MEQRNLTPNHTGLGAFTAPPPEQGGVGGAPGAPGAPGVGGSQDMYLGMGPEFTQRG